MLGQLSDTIRREVETTIRTRISQSLIIDVYAAAEEISRRHGDENCQIEQIAVSIANLATQCGAAVEFGRYRAAGDDLATARP